MLVDNPRLSAAISKIPLLAHFSLEVLAPQRLGGLTNHNYLLQTPELGRYVLRLGGPGTGDYIDRTAEKYNSRVASQSGVNVDIHYFDEHDGTMLTRFVDAETMSVDSFRDLDKVRRAALAFKRLHDCGPTFQGEFELFEQIDMYLAVLQKLDCPIPDDYHAVKAQAREVREALGRWKLPWVACHCDPLYENFLDTGERMFIIDFEYAGNNDPMWDLGDLSVECEFSPEQDKVLMETYFGAPPSAFDQARMVMYKALSDLLWTLWGVVQHAHGNPADDFWEYSVNRLKRGKSLMLSKQFREHLKVVTLGPLY
jgi:thiamine kinase-like enzyme